MERAGESPDVTGASGPGHVTKAAAWEAETCEPSEKERSLSNDLLAGVDFEKYDPPLPHRG